MAAAGQGRGQQAPPTQVQGPEESAHPLLKLDWNWRSWDSHQRLHGMLVLQAVAFTLRLTARPDLECLTIFYLTTNERTVRCYCIQTQKMKTDCITHEDTSANAFRGDQYLGNLDPGLAYTSGSCLHKAFVSKCNL